MFAPLPPRVAEAAEQQQHQQDDQDYPQDAHWFLLSFESLRSLTATRGRADSLLDRGFPLWRHSPPSPKGRGSYCHYASELHLFLLVHVLRGQRIPSPRTPG